MLERRHRPAPLRLRRFHVRFKLGETCYALPAEELFGVHQVEDLTILPSDQSWNLGVTLFRGQAFGIVDLQSLMDGTESVPPSVPFFCIFYKTTHGVLGFRVDEILGIEAVFNDDHLPDGWQSLNLKFLESLA